MKGTYSYDILHFNLEIEVMERYLSLVVSVYALLLCFF